MLVGGRRPARAPELASCALDLLAEVSSNSVSGTAFNTSSEWEFTRIGSDDVPFTITWWSGRSSPVEYRDNIRFFLYLQNDQKCQQIVSVSVSLSDHS